jgi:CDP-glucose 4,6-dehydratase
VAERRSSLAQDESRDWHGRRVFVTGATGLLGSALSEALVARGAEVTCLVRDWVPSSPLVLAGTTAHANVVRGDLLDLDLLVRAVNEYEIDTVFHLGAQTIVGTASRSPLSTFESNIRGTWNLLEACRLNARLVQRVVVASSDKAYGIHERLPYTEDAPLQGRFPYDVSKSCADLIALSYAHTYGTPVVVTRCGNLWGPGDLNYNRLIPGTIRSALLDESPIVRSDGTFRRDYFFVRDAVDAYLTLAEHMAVRPLAGQAFNFGNETPVTVLEVVETILRVMGKPSLRPVVLNEASDEIPNQYLDCTKARRVLGWTPRYPFERGLDETIPWYAAQLHERTERRPGAADPGKRGGSLV